MPKVLHRHFTHDGAQMLQAPFHMTLHRKDPNRWQMQRLMFQPHKGVVNRDPRNVKRRTTLVIPMFQHPNAQARVFDHL